MFEHGQNAGGKHFRSFARPAKTQNTYLNGRKRSELERQACPFVHLPEISRKSMLLLRATARLPKKHHYYARGVVGRFAFATPLERYCDFGRRMSDFRRESVENAIISKNDFSQKYQNRSGPVKNARDVVL